MTKFPYWDHSEGVHYPQELHMTIADQLDAMSEEEEDG